jgi:uncharacterized damage-inducible protein DinB
MNHCILYTFNANKIILDTITNHTITDEKVLKVMSHIVLSAQNIINHIDKQKSNSENTFKITSTRELIRINEENRQNLERLEMTRPINELVTYITPDGHDLSNTLGDIFQHLFFHAAHHRGQISMLLSERIKLPLEVNYIAYTSKHRQTSIF